MLVSVHVLKISELVNGMLCYISSVDCVVFVLRLFLNEVNSSVDVNCW